MCGQRPHTLLCSFRCEPREASEPVLAPCCDGGMASCRGLVLPGSGISRTRSEPSHPQHTTSNYCTALPVCSPGPVPTAQRQGVNTALLTVHTARARRHALYTKRTSTQRRNFTWLHTMDLLFPRPSVPNSPDGQFAAYSIMYAYK